jgi:hypothetical protein
MITRGNPVKIRENEKILRKEHSQEIGLIFFRVKSRFRIPSLENFGDFNGISNKKSAIPKKLPFFL